MNLYTSGIFLIIIGCFFLHSLIFIGLFFVFIRVYFFKRRKIYIDVNNKIVVPMVCRKKQVFEFYNECAVQFDNSFYHHFGIYCPTQLEIESYSKIDENLRAELQRQTSTRIFKSAMMITFSSTFGTGKMIIQNNYSKSLLKIFVLIIQLTYYFLKLSYKKYYNLKKILLIVNYLKYFIN